MDPALEQEWQRRIQDNQDVQQAKVDLEFHRAKIRQMQVQSQICYLHRCRIEWGNNVGRNDRYFDLRSIIIESSLQEELTQAEVWERQLEQRIIRTKEMLKPPIMKFSEQLENCKAVDEADIEATFGEKNVNADQVVKILRRKALEVHKLGRNELLGFINMVLNIRNYIVDSENPTEGLKEVVETVAGKILSQLGRPSIDWTGMQEGQLRIVRSSHCSAFQFGFIMIFSSGDWLPLK